MSGANPVWLSRIYWSCRDQRLNSSLAICNNFLFQFDRLCLGAVLFCFFNRSRQFILAIAQVSFPIVLAALDSCSNVGR